MQRPNQYLFLICILAMALIRCAVPKNTYSSKENLYKKSTHDPGTRLVAFHINDSVTRIFFSFSNENLLYKRPDTSGWFYSTTKVRYVLHSVKTQQMLDSGSTIIFDRQTENVNSKRLSGSLYPKCVAGQEYVCDVFVYDMNKKVRSSYVLQMDKRNTSTRENFLLQKKDGTIIFDYHLHQGDTILISSSRNNETNFTVDHFRREFPLPPPPFSMTERGAFKYKPDSSFVISKKKSYLKVAMPEKGFLHIITEKETKEGVSLFSVGPAFPGLKDEVEMIKCVRYITSLHEYNKLMDSDNKKQAIDEFWKEIGGSNERAKALLKKYYGRVYEANRLFTSFLPGWQSDRGMIYIVFGPPGVMYKYPNSELWIYGDENLPTSIKFNFTKYVNPFTDNDFVLERNEFYKLPWDQATRGWKEGHIYFDN